MRKGELSTRDFTDGSERRREEEELRVIKGKSVTALMNAAFAEDDALFAPAQGLADECPFFKTDVHFAPILYCYVLVKIFEAAISPLPFGTGKLTSNQCHTTSTCTRIRFFPATVSAVPRN